MSALTSDRPLFDRPTFNPGPFDPLPILRADEPYFALRADDPLAPAMVELWAALRSGQDVLARWKLDELLALVTSDVYEPAPEHGEKIANCRRIAAEMREFRVAAAVRHSRTIEVKTEDALLRTTPEQRRAALARRADHENRR